MAHKSRTKIIEKRANDRYILMSPSATYLMQHTNFTYFE